jgi:uncharacterized protein with NRDE domain
MCTIVVAHRLHADYPLVVAANRDEFYHREARPPQRLAPGVWGGVDVEKGGSWLGSSEAGLFVGLTNQRAMAPASPRLRSRGEIVVRALSSGSVAAACALLQAIDPAEYNPFNLFVADAHRLVVAYARPEGLTIEEPGPGLHVLTNDVLGSPYFPKAGRAAALAGPALGRRWGEGLGEGLARALADHERPAEVAQPPGGALPAALARELQAVCVHTEGYGTRSAALIVTDETGLIHYLFADGPPCVTPFVDVRGGPAKVAAAGASGALSG